MTTDLRAIIVDDEPLARKGLKMLLAETGGVEVVAECSNGREAVNRVAELESDLLFLDIQMPGMSGFDVVARLQQDNMPLIIFVTAYDEYAVRAFDVHAVDYLLKPIAAERLEDAVRRARRHRQADEAAGDKQRLLDLIMSVTGRSEQSVARLLKDHRGVKSWPGKITIRDGNETTLLPTERIDWVDAAGDYMCIHADNETHVMRITMKELIDQLDPTTFQRVHRSTIVNLDRVTRVRAHRNGEFHLILNNDVSIKMSRSYKEKVRHLL